MLRYQGTALRSGRYEVPAMGRQELAGFLRGRREALHPRDVGLPAVHPQAGTA